MNFQSTALKTKELALSELVHVIYPYSAHSRLLEQVLASIFRSELDGREALQSNFPPLPIDVMPRRPSFKQRKTPDGWVINSPGTITATGKREQHFFKTRDEAKAHGAKLREKFFEDGAKSNAITPSMADDATAAAALLKPWGLSLLEAARIAADMREKEAASSTVTQALATWLLSCEGLRAPTLATYKNTTKRFDAALGSRVLATLTTDDIQKGLGLVGTVGAAAANHYRAGRAFWRWAAKKGWCNPEVFNRVDPPRTSKPNDVKFLTVDQCKTLLSAAEKHFPQAVASYAVLLFAGLRPSEFARLRTEDVSSDGIEVNADSKIAKRRHITPIKTLRAWLERYPFERVSNWRRVDQAVRYLAGWDVWTDPDFFTPPPSREPEAPRLPWPQDGTRHTFGTYSINGGVTLDHFLWEFGHSGNTRTLKTHYLGRASKKQALEFFALRPVGQTAEVVQLEAGEEVG